MAILRKIVLLLLLVISLITASAQTDLNTLLDQSKVNYPLLKSRAAEITGASHEVKAAAMEYIPKVSLQHQYTYGTSNSVAGAFYPNPAVISPSGGIRADNSDVATWGSFTSALLEWNIFNFGKVSGSVRASQASRESFQAAYDNEVFQHQVRVADAYLLALIAAKISSIQQENLERAAKFKQVVVAGVRSGLRPAVDSALASAEYVKAKLLLLESERNSNAQSLRLMELTGSLKEDVATIDSMKFFTTLPPVSGVDSVNREINPLLRLYRARTEASSARSVALRRSFLPSITLVGAVWARGSGVYNGDDSFHTSFSDGTKYQVNNYLLGISTRWTISDFAPIHQRYKSERYRVVRDQELYNEQDLKVRRQLRESHMYYDVALEQANTAPTQLLAARQAFQQANARYKSGLSDLPTLLQSMVTLNRAEADLAVAYSNAWRSLLGVAAASGDLSLFLRNVQ
jgi:outer membrane protein TolC